MELLQLRYFLKSAENENFSATASEYNVPPSAVSVSVKKLESELGIKLFNRSANKIKLNKSGRRFADCVAQALSLLDSETANIKSEINGISGDIYILVRTERSLVADKMISFRNKYPNVKFHLIHDYNLTDYSKFDIVIDENTNGYIGFTQKALINEKIKIAASKKSPLLKKELCLKDLKDTPFIAMSKNSSLYRITENICLKVGFAPKIVIESDDPYYIRKYISEDFGIAFYPESSWQHDMGSIGFLNIIDFDFSRTTYAYLNPINASKASKLFFDSL